VRAGVKVKEAKVEGVVYDEGRVGARLDELEPKGGLRALQEADRGEVPAIHRPAIVR